MTDRIPDEIMREAIKICDPSFSGGTRVNDAQPSPIRMSRDEDEQARRNEIVRAARAYLDKKEKSHD